jgi:hypothetical protein
MNLEGNIYYDTACCGTTQSLNTPENAKAELGVLSKLKLQGASKDVVSAMVETAIEDIKLKIKDELTGIIGLEGDKRRIDKNIAERLETIEVLNKTIKELEGEE